MHLTPSAIAAGLRVFPGVKVDPAGFAAFLSSRDRGTVPAAWPELFLAYACARADAAALHHFDERYLSVVRPAVRHVDPDAAFADEVRQQLRVRFFVGPPPRILEYLGLGSLEGWVRAAAVRLALDSKRRDGRAPELGFELAAEDAELEHLAASHRPQLERALKQAFQTLSSRERAVLQLHAFEKAGIDRIAALYGIHRATAARWLERIREALRERTLAALGEHLGATPTDAASLVRVLMSGVELSLRRQLLSVSSGAR